MVCHVVLIKKPETMKEIVEQVVSEFIEEKKLEKLPVAIA